MAHLEKYTKTQLGIVAHYDRSRQSKRENIDRAKTCENYNLAPLRDCTQGEYIAERLKNVRIQNRSDVNYICDWIITMPKDLDISKRDEFFHAVYDYCNNKYGGENGKNVVSAYVHLDESTPHMHFCFLPVVEDKRRGGEKLSSKIAVGGPKDLQKFHINLQKFCTDRLKTQVNILNDATRDGNKSIADLKRGTAQEMVTNYNQLIKQARESLDKAKEVLAAAEAKTEMPTVVGVQAEKKTRFFGLFTDADKYIIRETELDRLCKNVQKSNATAQKFEKLYHDTVKYNTAALTLDAPAREIIDLKQNLNNAKKQIKELSALADGAKIAELRQQINILNDDNDFYRRKAIEGQDAAEIIAKINAVDTNIIPQTLKLWHIQESQRQAAEKAKKEQKKQEIQQKQQKNRLYQKSNSQKKQTKNNDFSL